MNVTNADDRLSGIAGAIAEPARTKMLCCLLDGHARTSTELAVVADVSPSTASVHLARLKDERLVKVLAQGKHRYYSLENPSVASALEALMIVAGGPREAFVPNTPDRLRAARTCYDHMAGSLAVSIHDRFTGLRWLVKSSPHANDYDITDEGFRCLANAGLDVPAIMNLRRRVALACLDWSEGDLMSAEHLVRLF